MNIIKLLPPLIIGDEEIDFFVAALDDVLADAHRSSGLLLEVGKRPWLEHACAATGLRRPAVGPPCRRS